MTTLVLDAFALVAWLREQAPAAALVGRLFVEAEAGACCLAICALNLGEVYYSEARRQGHARASHDIGLLRTRVAVLPVPDDLVMRAAALKADHPISYADAFAAATALELDAPLVTGDPELRALARRLPRLRLHWLGAAGPA